MTGHHIAKRHTNMPVKDTSEIAVIPRAIALAYDRARSSRVGFPCRSHPLSVRQCTHRNGLPIPSEMVC